MKYKYKVKVICGFRKDQEYSIDANEAHKAYYLFNNPDKRGTFSGGVSIANVQSVVPDLQGTMGWNSVHKLTSEDWNEITRVGISEKLDRILAIASEVAKIGDPEDIKKPLSRLVEEKYPQLLSGGSVNPETKQLADKMNTRHV